MRIQLGYCQVALIGAVFVTGCALVDPPRYEYSRHGGDVEMVRLDPVEAEAGDPEGQRMVEVIVYGGPCLPGCSTVIDYTCETLSFENNTLVIRWFAEVETLVDQPGWRPVVCGAVCKAAYANCGVVSWPIGTDLRIETENGSGVTISAESTPPVTAGGY
jgi:hypothetical protein